MEILILYHICKILKVPLPYLELSCGLGYLINISLSDIFRKMLWSLDIYIKIDQFFGQCTNKC